MKRARLGRTWLATVALATALSITSAPAWSQSAPSPARTLPTNVHVFDGVNEKRNRDASVLTEGNVIERVSTRPIPAQVAAVIDGGGRTWVPGLSDAHVHLTVNDSFEQLIDFHPQVQADALGAVNAKAMLHRGFTTVRDVGGPTQGLKPLIDRGDVEGARILPSGAFVSQTSGHGDLDPRMSDLSSHFVGGLDESALLGWTLTADGVPEVQEATRKILRSGTLQAAFMGSGGITGAHDPLDVTEYTFEEQQAIVKGAERWDTDAGIDAYTDEGVRNAIDAGVRSIEHALFASDETMKEKDVFFSTQFLAFSATPEVAGFSGETAENDL